jgi:hypothetical protein
MPYEAILTTLGLAKIADAVANNTSVNITTGKIGDGNGNAVTPNPSWTNLARVVYTAALNRVDIDPVNNTRVLAELVIPANQGGWTVREIGLFDNTGALIAVAAYPAVYKPTAAEGATLDMIVRLILNVSNTSAITLQVDTSIIVASRSWVDANFNLTALLPGGTTNQILRKASNADGDTEWADATDVNVVVELIQEEQTLATSQTTVTLAICTTDNSAVYIEGVRLHPGDWTATNATTITLATSYADGSKILVVQNEPAGENDYLKSVNNLSDVPNKETARSNLELLSNATYLNELWLLMKKRDYPVGEILETRRAGNPATWLGFGTWERYGVGRVKVGFDPADASFNALDKTGGAKTHVLTEAEMPSHTHTATARGDDGFNSGGGFGVVGFDHNIGPGSASLANTGGSQAHNNLQPYITVFMWLRYA